MAYNPFDFFRKNTKIFMVVVTIFIMFMFVLSFGQGDFFSAIPRWLARLSNIGESVAKINGTKVTSQDLSELSTKRNAVNILMTELSGLEMRRLQADLSPLYQKLASVYDEQQLAQTGKTPPAPIDRQSGGFKVWSLTQMMIQAGQSVQLGRLREAAGALVQMQGTTSTLAPAEKEALQASVAYSTTLVRLFERGQASYNPDQLADRNTRPNYFSNQPDVSVRDRLDFKLWLKKADQLGIRYTQTDVVKLVEAEFPNLAITTPEGNPVIAAIGRVVDQQNSRDLNIATLLNAVADEFRVRTAQTALMGNSVVSNSFSNVAVPLAAKQQLFQEMTQTTRLGMLTVPVSAYLASVAGEPTEAELKQIFQASRQLVPDPSSSRGGLTEPRKVRVQFLTVSGKEAFYTPRVKAQAKATPALPLLLGAAATADLPTFTYEQYLAAQRTTTESWKNARQNAGDGAKIPGLAFVLGTAALAPQVNPSAFNAFAVNSSPMTLTDASITRPETIGVLAGLLGGAVATGGSPFTAPLLLTQAAYASEDDARLLAGVRALVIPTLSSTTALAELAGELAAQATLPAALPQSLVQPMLDSRTEDLQRGQLVANDLRAFDENLAKIMAGTDKAAAQLQAAEYVAKFAAERGLTVGITATPRDVYTIFQEPALAPLVELNPTLLTVGKLNDTRVQHAFGYGFFYDGKPSFNQGARRMEMNPVVSNALYSPRLYTADASQANRASDPSAFFMPMAPTSYAAYLFADGAKPTTLFWRVQDVDPVRPLSLSDAGVREKCTALWKQAKARELAKQAVETVKAAIDKQVAEGLDDPTRLEQSMRDMMAQISEKIPNLNDRFNLKLTFGEEYDNAKMLYRPTTSPGMPPSVVQFNLSPSDSLLYPTEKLGSEMAKLRDEPIGKSIIGTDKPESHYYLAVVADKRTQPADDFRNYVLDDSMKMFEQFASGQMRPLRGQFLQMSQLTTAWAVRQQALELLKAEFNVEEDPKLLDSRE